MPLGLLTQYFCTMRLSFPLALTTGGGYRREKALFEGTEGDPGHHEWVNLALGWGPSSALPRRASDLREPAQSRRSPSLVMVASVSSPRVPRPLTPVMAPAALDHDGEVVLVAVPALNEERFIGSVVHEVRMLGFECLVIDDGSTDRTAAIAMAAGAQVERIEHNLGKAAALNVAFEIARRRGVSVLVAMDGDWQHNPQEIPDLIAPIRMGIADVVTGSRFLPKARGKVPVIRSLGMRALTAGSGLVSGLATTDSLSGFRAFGRSAIEAFTFKSQGFSAEFEMQFMARDHGLRHHEVPITARYDDPAKRNVLTYGLNVLDGLIRLAARYRPLLSFGLPSALTLLIGIVVGALVVDTYQRAGELAAGSALLSVLLIILGSIGLFAAILLHVLRGISVDLEEQLKALAASVSADGARLSRGPRGHEADRTTHAL